MEINNNLKEKIESIPQGIQEIAMQILHEIERGKKSNKQVEEMIIHEIRELISGSVKFDMKKRFKRIARFCIRSLKYNDVRST